MEQETHVPPSSTMCRVFHITPSLSDNKDKRGLALDGQLKHEDTNLASTTICKVHHTRYNTLDNTNTHLLGRNTTRKSRNCGQLQGQSQITHERIWR